MQCNENTFLILQTLAYSEGFLPRPLKEPESASVSSEPIYLQSDARDTILCWSACVRCSIILFFVISDIQLSLLSSHSRAAGTEYFFPQAWVAITHHGDGNGGWNGEPAPKPPGPTATYLWVWCSMQQSFFFLQVLDENVTFCALWIFLQLCAVWKASLHKCVVSSHRLLVDLSLILTSEQQVKRKALSVSFI